MPFFGIGIGFAAISLALFSINRRLPAHARKTNGVEGHAVQRVVSEFAQVLTRPWARVVPLTVFLEGAFLYGAFAFIATHLHEHFGLPLASAGSTLMLFGFGGLLFALASKRLVRGLGEVRLMMFGGLLLAASLLVVGIAPVWWWALPGCFIAGLGFYMFHNTLQINATQMAPEHRDAAVSAFAASFFLGQAASVGIDGALVAQIGTGAVISIGAFGVLLVALMFSRLRAVRGAAPA